MLANVIAVASAELRSTRRLARYWVFAVLSVVISFFMYMQYSVMHGMGSHLSATIARMGPRYLVAEIGLYVLILFLVGLVFLAFDVRTRDMRERMVEVLDVRPLNNAEFLLGRGLALVSMALAPLLFLILLVQGFGTLAPVMDWPIGERIEPYSLIDLVIHCFTIFAWWCSIVMLLAVLIRNRLVVAVASLLIFGLYVWGVTSVPLYLQNAFGLLDFGAASDLIPSLVPAGGFLPRMGIWCMTVGFIALAVAFHPRRDDAPKPMTVGLGGGGIVVGVAIMITQALLLTSAVDERAAWLAAHQAREAELRVNVIDVNGSIRIVPGDDMVLDYALRVSNPHAETLNRMLFSFNPGFLVDKVTFAGRNVDWTFENGLLDIDADLAPASEAQVEIIAWGIPNLEFGYLDAALDFDTMSFSNAQLFLLGIENGVFDSRYVGLLAGLRWLPRSGADVPTADPRALPTDYFTVDLTVEVPPEWLVAGPGRREQIGAGKYRFAPAAPVHEVGLFASEFERRVLTVEGVEFELLFSPKHRRNLVFFADAREALEARLGEVLRNAADIGLYYPYGAFSLVEAPIHLRGYGGGWRLDTALSTPGIMIAKEASFPTARFESRFSDPETFDDVEGGLGAAKVAAMETFFENDFSGGNIFIGGARNFFSYQTSATGEGAIALNFILDELTSLLVTDTRGYFSAHEFNADSGLIVGEIMQAMFGEETQSIAQAMVDAASDRPAVWDRAISTPLAAIDPEDDPKETLNLLALKGRAMAESIIDGIGRETIGSILSSLVERYQGRGFTVAEFEEVAAAQGADLSRLIGDWLNDTGMPGFVTSRVTIDRLVDDDLGNPVYQTRFHVRNDEKAPGLFKIRYALPSGAAGDELNWQSSDPYWIDAESSLEIGLYGSAAPVELRLLPYFSLNRQEVALTVPAFDQARLDRPAFYGALSSEWRLRDSLRGDIIVDDLDPGFAVEDDDPRPVSSGIQFGFSAPRVDLDQGLPEFRSILGSPLVWSRTEDLNAHGKYRHTVALVQKGEGLRRALFDAEIPKAGRYRLSFHVPEQRVTNVNVTMGAAGTVATTSTNTNTNRLGMQELHLEYEGSGQMIEFDGSAAAPGWNDLGDFHLPRGNVRLTISDETTGEIVIADAMRWRPLP